MVSSMIQNETKKMITKFLFLDKISFATSGYHLRCLYNFSPSLLITPERK
jgi:hypothetical protein